MLGEQVRAMTRGGAVALYLHSGDPFYVAGVVETHDTYVVLDIYPVDGRNAEVRGLDDPERSRSLLINDRLAIPYVNIAYVLVTPPFNRKGREMGFNR